MIANTYETNTLLHQYLLFHYGSADEVLPYSFGPHESLQFPVRCVEQLLDKERLTAADSKIALDIGSSVGRSSFALSNYCNQVIGIDYSKAFIEAATQLQAGQSIPYQSHIEGTRYEDLIAKAPDDAHPENISFEHGDATKLRPDLPASDVLLAANLICRLPQPMDFLSRVPELVKPGGQLLITTPFTWMDEYTAPENWLGNQSGDSFEGLTHALSDFFELDLQTDIPFFIRDHSRKFQWSVAQGSRWIRK